MGKVIVVTSGKGGVGKTTSSAALGAALAQTGQRVGIGPSGGFIGGNGMSGREGQLIALSPDLKRYSANLIGHFEVSPAFVPFIEAKYVRSEAVGSVTCDTL